MKLLRILSASFALLLLVNNSNAKEWRGIVPLHSTRSDVTQLLGTPVKKAGRQYWYDLPDAKVWVEYSGSDCAGGYNPPKWTVIIFSVSMKTNVPFSSLKIDESQYKKDTGGDSGMIDYYNRDEGIIIEVSKYQGNVVIIHYYPTAADEKDYSCSKLRRNRLGRSMRLGRFS